MSVGRFWLTRVISRRLRLAQDGRGMTFDQYVTHVGTAENLEREAGW